MKPIRPCCTGMPHRTACSRIQWTHPNQWKERDWRLRRELSVSAPLSLIIVVIIGELIDWISGTLNVLVCELSRLLGKCLEWMQQTHVSVCWISLKSRTENHSTLFSDASDTDNMTRKGVPSFLYRSLANDRPACQSLRHLLKSIKKKNTNQFALAPTHMFLQKAVMLVANMRRCHVFDIHSNQLFVCVPSHSHHGCISHRNDSFGSRHHDSLLCRSVGVSESEYACVYIRIRYDWHCEVKRTLSDNREGERDGRNLSAQRGRTA